jgi:hypothetical protein
MPIDIDELTESELVDLNHRIVARLRLLRQADAHTTMLGFRFGERVTLQPDGRPAVTGMITRYNKRTVSIVTDDGHRWMVAPQFLERAAPRVVATPGGNNVVSIQRIDRPFRKGPEWGCPGTSRCSQIHDVATSQVQQGF